jgi:hypothetical protein
MSAVFIPKNIKSPPDLSVEQGQMGDGSSPCSLSRTGIRRSPSRGLPASRRHSPRQAEFRPRSRAVQRLSAAEFRVRLFSSLGLMVAPPACEPGQDTPAIFFRVLTFGSGSAAAFDGAFARCHGSRLFTQRLLFFHSPAASFSTSPAFGSFSRSLPSCRGLPVSDALFVPPFGVFHFGKFNFFIFEFRQSHPHVLMRSSNRCLSRQLRFIQVRNLPELLDSARSGFSSLLAAGSSFAYGVREHARGAGEFCLRCLPFGRLRGVGSISLTRLFPGHPGLSWKRAASILFAAAHFVLSMN